MKLHLDQEAFRVLIDTIHTQTGYRGDVLEKDYYVSLILKELAGKQSNGLPAYFKGGTALYKALKTTNRFSEDIDLSVDTRICSRTQTDKRLEQATKKYTSLLRDSSLGKTNRSEVVAVYSYEPLTAFDVNDALQRFGRVKVEATSFTISELVECLEIAAMLYELASNEQKQILESEYDVGPFSIMTISIERVFIDKLFAAEAYVRKAYEPHRAFEAAKHIYYLAVIYKHKTVSKLLDIRIAEEINRLDGIPNVLPSDFIFFTNSMNNKDVRTAYEIMQNQYVLRDCDRIDYDKAMDALTDIYKSLLNNTSWVKYQFYKAW